MSQRMSFRDFFGAHGQAFRLKKWLLCFGCNLEHVLQSKWLTVTIDYRICHAVEKATVRYHGMAYQIIWKVPLYHTRTTILRPFFRDHPGELMPEENFWTLWCKGRLTEPDAPTIRLGATPSALTTKLVAWSSGRALVFGRCGFAVLRSTGS